METLDRTITNALNEAIKASDIVGHFQYGHNLFQSPVQVDEIFGMLDTIIKKVSDAINDVIPDINLAPYKNGKVDSTRANLCWIQLTDNYYGLMLNVYKGIKYRPFDDEDIQNLLLNGQTSSWFLISKVQNLAYLLANDMNKGETLIYFKSLIISIIEKFFEIHETSDEYHPFGEVDADMKLETLFSRYQIQNTRIIVPTSEDKKGGPSWNQSIITISNGDKVCWQSASNFQLVKMGHTEALKILASEYLTNRYDVEVFLESTFQKYRGDDVKPNEFCFMATAPHGLQVSYVDLNYVVESQLIGYITVFYENGEKEKIYPDVQPIVIEKGKNNITFIVIIKLDNDIVKKVSYIETIDDNNGNQILPNLKLACSLTGISEKNNGENNV